MLAVRRTADDSGCDAAPAARMQSNPQAMEPGRKSMKLIAQEQEQDLTRQSEWMATSTSEHAVALR